MSKIQPETFVDENDPDVLKGNLKDDLLFDYGRGKRVYKREDIKVYGKEAIDDQKCNSCEKTAMYKCNRKINYRGDKYFNGCGQYTCQECAYLDQNQVYNQA